MPKPSRHLALALPVVAAVPSGWRVPLLAGAVLIDADHLLDLAYVRSGGDHERVFLPLHGLDVLAALAALAAWRRSGPLTAFALGVTLHLAMDLQAENVNWVKVSLLWRAARGFRTPGRRRTWMDRPPTTWV